MIGSFEHYDTALILENNGTIKDLFIRDFHVVNSNTNLSYNAGLVAVNNGVVKNVSFSGELISNSLYTAGVVAKNNGNVDTAISDGIITGTGFTAGVVGMATTTSINNALGNSSMIIGKD